VRELKLSLLEKEDHLEEEVEVLRQVISAIIVIKLVIGLMNVILVQEVVDVAVAAAAVVVDIDHTGVEEVEGTEVPQDQKAETIEDIDLLDIKEADVTDEVIAEIVTEGEKESVLTHPDLTKGLS
jgi:hypothetical protein